MGGTVPRQQRAAWAVTVLASLRLPQSVSSCTAASWPGLLEVWVAEHWWVLGCSCMGSRCPCASEQKQAAIQRSAPEFV